MSLRISVIIPNRNGGKTIGHCLEAVFASSYDDFEVIVVDDSSTDGSVGIISRYPCRLVRLDRHSGAAASRNAGARNSTGDLLFFIDSDCLPLKETLSSVAANAGKYGDVVFGGTYTPRAADDSFFSTFQSVFIHYSETKKAEPDYVATHAMAIKADLFSRSGGFPEDFMPILEDVEFSHRLRRSGVQLRMDQNILVRHIFNFNMARSLGNAFRKSLYWTVYSLANRDLHRDSGTASFELKTAVLAWPAVVIPSAVGMMTGRPLWIICGAAAMAAAAVFNRRFLSLLFSAGGPVFGFTASLYYMLVYPIAVSMGGITGLLRYLTGYAPRLGDRPATGASD